MKNQSEWDFLHVRVPKQLKDQYQELCKSRASSVSQQTRQLFEQFCSKSKNA